MASAATIPERSKFTGSEQILPEQIFTRELKPGETPKFDEAAAASLIWQDYVRAKNAIDTQAWQTQWEDNDILYNSPLLTTADPAQARVSRFTVNNQANTMADACKDGLFAQSPPFLLRPRGDTTQEDADAWTALISVLLTRMKFQYWTGLGIDSQSLHGTGIWKCGWGQRTRTVMVRVPKSDPESVNLPAGTTKVNTSISDEYDLVPKVITESYPWLENRMLGTTLFDPGWRTPNAPELCGYVVDIDYVTWMDLEQLRKESCYDIPDSQELKDFCFKTVGAAAPQGTSVEANLSRQGSPVLHAENRNMATTANPLQQPILLLGRHDEQMSMEALVINGFLIVIRNEEHYLGRIPHFTANWRNILNTGWGMGMGKLVGGDQRLEQGTLNHALNLLAYMFNPVILHSLGQNAPTQNRVVRAGGFWNVTPGSDGDVRKGMAVMDMPKVPPETWQFIQYAKQSSEETSGADATFMQGNLQGKGSSAARTATGAGRIAAKADGRVQTPVENLELGLFIPFLSMLMTMIKLYMPTKEIRDILSTKLSKDLLESFEAKKFIESDFEVEMSAASKMAAKTAMAQQLPLLMQILNQPQLIEQLHAEGKTIDLNVLLDILFQVSEFRIEDQIIRNMNDEEKKTVQSMHAPNAKVQEATVTEQLKGQNASQLEHQKSQSQLLLEVIKHVLGQNGEQRLAQLTAQLGDGSQPPAAAPASASHTPLDRATGFFERDADKHVFDGTNNPLVTG